MDTNQQRVKSEFGLVFAHVEAKIRRLESVAIKLSIEWENGQPKDHEADVSYRGLNRDEGSSPQAVKVRDVLRDATNFVKCPQLERALTIVTIEASIDQDDVLTLDGEASYFRSSG